MQQLCFHQREYSRLSLVKRQKREEMQGPIKPDFSAASVTWRSTSISSCAAIASLPA
jgi:hypothetical protein